VTGRLLHRHGGLIGSAGGKNEGHDFSQKTRVQKLVTLRFIISKLRR
jgi:hypothetical protein